nr:site-specific integrase [Desulfovibrio psychrotolerans]
MGRIQRHILPALGSMAYDDVTAQHVRDMVQRIAGRGKVDVARRCCDLVNQIYKYGIVTGKTEKNPAAYVKAVLPAQSQTLKHHAALTDPKEVGRLMRSIEEFQGTFVVKCALQIAAYTFLRSSEIRKAPWSEIDFESRLWRIPAERMKRNNPHLVPLSDQAISVLRELHPLTQNADFIFPSVRTDSKPLSENTLNVALRGMGFSKEQMTLHGFRAMASSLLNERGYSSDWIEKQLAHTERNKVRAAYNRADFLQDRIRMMQAWADYLDHLRDGGKVIPFPVKVTSDGS